MISFIITCFNNIDILKCCLNSFLWQSQSLEYEIILIDNNSNVSDPNVVYQHFYPDLPLWLIKQPKLPHSFAPAHARNIGLKLAKYPWIATLDSDIIINPNYVSSIGNIIAHRDNLLITGERIFIQLDEVTLQQPKLSHEIIKKSQRVKSISNYFLEKDRRMSGLQNLSQHPHPWALMHSGNTIFPKELALKIGGYNESYDGFWGYEDIDFAYRLLSETACNPYFDEKLFVYHVENRDSTRDKQRFDKNTNPNWMRICQKIPGFKEFKQREYAKLSKLISI